MLIINDTQIQEEGEIYERPYITRGIKRNCIEITIGKQDNVTYDTLVNTFSDGASIIRCLKEKRIEKQLVSEATETEEAVYQEVEVEYDQDYPLTDFVVAGDIIDKRDGTFVVYMGVKTETEILEEQNAELMLTLVGGEE